MSIARAYDRPSMAASVVGRDVELAVIADFLAGISDGASVLVLEGEAGMGKTTLWRSAIERAEASSMVVLRAQPAESEMSLSFSALGDLLDPVLGTVLAPLPPAQRAALSRALVLDDSEDIASDAHAVGVALLGVLRTLAADGPLLLAVDDVQWLDAATAAAVAYAGRRLRDESIGILLARRTGLVSAVADELRRSLGERAGTCDARPLDGQALHRVISDRLGVTLPRPLLVEIQHASGGNPLYAIEIVRTLQRRGAGVAAGQPLPVPDSLHDLVDERLAALPEESRVFLLAAAAHAQPTVDISEAASGVSADEGLVPAVDAGIVELEGVRIRFMHPLLAAGVLESADPRRRADVHRRLAELLPDVEARAWQLAACTETPDEDVAAALEAAAQHARGRGAPRPAALLLDRAGELTSSELRPEAVRRMADAAYLHFESGDSPRAEARLRELASGVDGGSQRALVLARLARVRSYEAQDEAAELFLASIAECGDDDRMLATAHEGVATCYFRLREHLTDAVEHAETAAALALASGDEALAAEALGTRLLVETLLGAESASATAERAIALQSASGDRRLLAQPVLAAAVHQWWTDAVGEARATLTELLETAQERGDQSSLPFILVLLGQIESALGDLGSALDRAIAGRQAADQSGQSTLVVFHLALEASVRTQGNDADLGESQAVEALAGASSTAGRPAELLALAALGRLALSRGESAAALEHLGPAVAFVRREGIVEPGAIPFVTDHVEAHVELGLSDAGIEVLEWFEGNARRLERASALANCARCRGLLAAQAGDLDAALAAFDEALGWHARVELPLDRGRTLLALGATQRRLKRRREARDTLEAALGVFERIGAALWAERARGELKRISGRAATPGALTPAEQRVATLVAEGKTNKEVAAALFLSDRTVEGHLARIFGKLGIRHRTELAGALQTRGIAVSNTGDSPVSAAPSAP